MMMSRKKMTDTILERRLARIEDEILERRALYLRQSAEHAVALAFFLELALLFGAFMARRVLVA
jgi:hypothetical protein